MKLSDHESDTMAAARLGTPPVPPSPPTYRESWLDKLARHLGSVPVDHVMVPPNAFAPAKACNVGEKCPA